MNNIPFPTDRRGDNTFALHQSMSQKEIHDELRKWYLRLHPDKLFCNHFSLATDSIRLALTPKLTEMMLALKRTRKQFLKKK